MCDRVTTHSARVLRVIEAVARAGQIVEQPVVLNAILIRTVAEYGGRLAFYRNEIKKKKITVNQIFVRLNELAEEIYSFLVGGGENNLALNNRVGCSRKESYIGRCFWER